MKNDLPKFEQRTLLLRFLAGLYLVYTAWKLREAIAEKPLFIIPIVAFAAIGIALAAHAGWLYWKGDYEGAPGQAAEEQEAEEE